MLGYSLVVIQGNLTKEIELKKTTTGKTLAAFTVAVNGMNDEVTFVDCVAWEKAAESLHRLTTKGSPVLLEGRLVQNKWQDKDGNSRSRLEVHAQRALSQAPPKREEQTSDVAPDYIEDKPVDLSDIPF